MYVTLDETKKEFLKHMDEYGDNYTKYTDEDGLKDVNNMTYMRNHLS